MDKELWLFDYRQGEKYEKFSECEDYNKKIFKFLANYYNFNNKTILEIGAGSGKFTRFLAERCNMLYTVEKSPSLMKINIMKNCDIKNVKFILSDVKDLDFSKNSFDFIFAGWSLTSMRNLYDLIFPVFQNILKEDSTMILIENAGNDQFCNLLNINEFTKIMKEEYSKLGFCERTVLDTIIKLPNQKVFQDAFPQYEKTNLNDLEIKHKVLVLDKKIHKM